MLWLVKDTAFKKFTKSKALGIGNDEFIPWMLGAVM